VERTGGGLMARLAHPLFGELRRASAGEMHLSAIRGRLATRLAKNGDTDMQATVRRALLSLESDLEPEPELYLESARHAMSLLDLDLADRLATAATRAGAPGASRPKPRCVTWLTATCPTAITGRPCGRPTWCGCSASPPTPQ
jgi:hypothetical protein